MVNISHETSEESHARLAKVIKHCEFKTYSESYAFLEFPLSQFSSQVRSDALALVRDDEVWSQLVPCDDPTEELFTIWRFHFREEDDNSGFVGWLANHLKAKFGSGVFVTCGQNRNRGGIFDYSGCPLELGPAVINELQELVYSGNT